MDPPVPAPLCAQSQIPAVSDFPAIYPSIINWTPGELSISFNAPTPTLLHEPELSEEEDFFVLACNTLPHQQPFEKLNCGEEEDPLDTLARMMDEDFDCDDEEEEESLDLTLLHRFTGYRGIM